MLDKATNTKQKLDLAYKAITYHLPVALLDRVARYHHKGPAKEIVHVPFEKKVADSPRLHTIRS